MDSRQFASIISDAIRGLSREMGVISYGSAPDYLPDAEAMSIVAVADAFFSQYIDGFTALPVTLDRCMPGSEEYMHDVAPDPDAIHGFYQYRRLSFERYRHYQKQLYDQAFGFSGEDVYVMAYAAIFMDSVCANARANDRSEPILNQREYQDALTRHLSQFKKKMGFVTPLNAAQPATRSGYSYKKPPLMTLGKFVRLALMGLGLAFLAYIFGGKK